MLKGLQYVPWVIVTDKLKSYAAAKREILPHTEHRQSRYLNNRAEVSHQPTRRRERQMQRFRSARHAQCFLSSHSRIHNHFPLRRHHLTAADTVLPAPSLFAPGARSPALPPRRKPWSATSLWNCLNPQPDNALQNTMPGSLRQLRLIRSAAANSTANRSFICSTVNCASYAARAFRPICRRKPGSRII